MKHFQSNVDEKQFVLSLEDIEKLILSKHRYLFVILNEYSSLGVTFISSPDASKRTSLDEFFIKSILSYDALCGKNLENDYDGIGTEYHISVMYEILESKVYI